MADCTKIRYPSPWAASNALNAIVRKNAHRKPKVPVAIYPCAQCRAWHLTSHRQHGKAQKWNVRVH